MLGHHRPTKAPGGAARPRLPPPPPRRPPSAVRPLRPRPPHPAPSLPPDVTWTFDGDDATPRPAATPGPALSSLDDDTRLRSLRRAAAAAVSKITRAAATPRARAALQVGQTLASLLFVVLYVWSTYDAPAPGSPRALADAALCVAFATDYVVRFVNASSKTRMMLSLWNVLDALAVFPPLLELALTGGTSGVAVRGSSLDLRWFKILRALRVVRVALLAGEMGAMHASSSGRLLASAASVRLFQLVASVATLLFTTSAIVNVVERIPFHDALYFVTTTLTTVGFGDVVVRSFAGKAAVLIMIFVGIVLIPAQTGAVYAQLTARRQTIGPLPSRGEPAVLVSTRLSDVRGFSDFLLEFFSAATRGGLPRATRMVVLGGRAPFEFRALQELNDRRLTLVEGSALSERDLTRVRAEAAQAVLLLADRFSPDADAEDVSILFQCWAVKSYVKRVPVYVQVLRKASLAAVRPFLDPARDVAVSVEHTRHRLLALSALCPGASTLLANLLRRSSISPTAAARREAGGRRWLRAYMNGCGQSLHVVPLAPSYACVPFAAAAAAMHRDHAVALIGVLVGGRALLNPGRRLLRGGESAIVVAADAARAARAAAAPHRPLPPAAVKAARDGALSVPVRPPPPSPCAVGHVESESVDFEADGDECLLPGGGGDGDGSSGDERGVRPTLADSAAAALQATLDDDDDSADPPTFTTRVPPALATADADADADAARRAVAACNVGSAGWVDDSDYFGGANSRSDGLFGVGDDGKKAAAAAAVDAAAADATTPAPPLPPAPPTAPPSFPDTDDAPLLDPSGAPLTGHVVVAGSPASLLPFVEQLRACDPVATPVVVLAPTRPAVWADVAALGPAFYVRGEASATAGLRAARAASARALVFLALPLRPGPGPTGAAAAAPTPPPPPTPAFAASATADRADASRTAVLADAPGLLTCYGVGEEGGAAPPHAVVELCFTSSLRFLQPGLLLKGVTTGPGPAGGPGRPRRSWQARRAQEDAAQAEGLAAWQANPFFCAGRVTVPAVMDTFACHAYFGAGLLAELMNELAGDDGRPGGACLRQVAVPPDLVGARYGDLVARLALRRQLVAVGLYRRKSENATWRLSYVVTNPGPRTRLERGDRVFVLRERGGAWLSEWSGEE